MQLGPTTMDNASPNDTLCQQVELIHHYLELGDWEAALNQLMYANIPSTYLPSTDT